MKISKRISNKAWLVLVNSKPVKKAGGSSRTVFGGGSGKEYPLNGRMTNVGHNAINDYHMRLPTF